MSKEGPLNQLVKNVSPDGRGANNALIVRFGINLPHTGLGCNDLMWLQQPSIFTTLSTSSALEAVKSFIRMLNTTLGTEH